MAEFDVRLSAMADAANNIKNYTQMFKENGDAIYQAAQTLSEGWQGDASQIFVDNMEQLHNWMNEMAVILDTYSAALDKNRSNYEEGDIQSAGNFK